jgi:hypothetical protein
LFEVESSFPYKIDENKNLDVFEMVFRTNKSTKELVDEELLIF